MEIRSSQRSFPHARIACSAGPVSSLGTAWQPNCLLNQARKGKEMKNKEVPALALAITLWAAGSSFAQGAMGAGPAWGGRMYDPKTVETISGEVVSVEAIRGPGWGQSKGRGGAGHGVHLILKSDKEAIAVHLGPSWYLDKHGLTLGPGDHIEVHGSRILFEGKPAIIAAEVKKGGQSLKLRDADGLPAWRGQGRRGA